MLLYPFSVIVKMKLAYVKDVAVSVGCRSQISIIPNASTLLGFDSPDVYVVGEGMRYIYISRLLAMMQLFGLMFTELRHASTLCMSRLTRLRAT